ncbi:MAG: hypothetical protein RID53_32355 [Coleofasciculus sp. B1-GNL1-01]
MSLNEAKEQNQVPLKVVKGSPITFSLIPNLTIVHQAAFSENPPKN